MKIRTAVAVALLGFASLAQAQRFGFSHQTVPASSSDSLAVAFGDVDGDGDLDAFVGNYGQRNGLYLNDGTGGFTDVSATNLPAVLDDTRAVALGDVDGDGDLDALVGNYTQPDRLCLNDRTGVFTDAPAANFPTLPGSTMAVALRDVDGDGDLDAFVGVYDQVDRLCLNDGTGVFTDVSATHLPAFPGDSRSVAFGDVDGDGDLDALIGKGSAQPDRLVRNDGFGFFTDVSATNLPTSFGATTAVALGDVDGDGDLDAFLTDLNATDRLYRNDGTGAFTDVSATALPALIDFSGAVVLADVDGDADLDAYIGNAGGAQDRLYRNDGAGVFTDDTAASLPALTVGASAVALVDVDADGDLDAFLGNWHQNRLYLNDAAGVFSDVTAPDLPARFTGTRAVALGDLDGDGDLDAFLGNFSELERVFRNDGTGAFTDVTATALPPFTDYTVAVALGDVDGDGDLDAFLGAAWGCPPPIPICPEAQNRLLVNDGTGSFTDATATNLPLVSDDTAAVALGDVDGDGDLDAFEANRGSDLGRLYFNDGGGVFTDGTAGHIQFHSDSKSAVALGDVDGDGDLDAFFGNMGQNRLYLNDGAGVFVEVTATHLPAISDSTRAVALGDVDGDGDLDALVGNDGQPSRLWVNDGTGAFADVTATHLPVLIHDTQSVALGDADGDGDLDALFGNDGQPNRLCLNDGTGTFTDASATHLPGVADSTRAVALGDLDGDGDLDAFVGNSGQSRRYTNLTRQLAWRGVPRAGKPLVLDLAGPGFGTWALGVSTASASLPLFPFGTLRLDPAAMFAVAAGAFDPAGHASFSMPVPAWPALVGASVYWQAFVGLPAGFSNLEVTTVTGL